jgi:hypothetical protein
LLAAECHINPYFVATSYKEENKEELDQSLEALEEQRDAEVLRLIIKAALRDAENKKITPEKPPLDVLEDPSADLITLCRNYQHILLKFLSFQLMSKETALHEVLLQGLM